MVALDSLIAQYAQHHMEIVLHVFLARRRRGARTKESSICFLFTKDCAQGPQYANAWAILDVITQEGCIDDLRYVFCGSYLRKYIESSPGGLHRIELPQHDRPYTAWYSTFEICDILEEADMKLFNVTLKNAASAHRFLLALPPMRWARPC